MLLKGEMSMLNVLHLQEYDIDVVLTKLKMKKEGSPQFFMRIPLVIDCAELKLSKDADKEKLFDFSALKKSLLDLGFTPLGVRNAPTSFNKLLAHAGWTVLQANNNALASRLAKEDEKNNEQYNVAESTLNKKEEKTEQATSPQANNNASLTITKPVRSGQQIYATGGDLTVLAATSAGSEVMADGSIHVYGALRGRVLAGVSGNESARIFCQSLQAELIVIAGRYQLLDESDTQLIGKPAMIHLEGDKLIILPL